MVASLTLEEYNSIVIRFANDFRDFLRKQKSGGRVDVIGPEVGLEEIISGKTCRRFFEAWLQSPTPTSHPSDVWLLDRFTCAAFRYRLHLDLYVVHDYLTKDLGWRVDAARFAVRRIETGLDVLRVAQQW